ncbi:MAG: HAD-IA family hydrolase [Betaproteobacteria bacterium]
MTIAMASMRKYRLVVFDWDGTLVDSAGHIVHSIQSAAHDLDLPVPPDADASHIIGLGLIDAMEYLFPGVPVDRYAQVADRYRHHYVSGAGVVKLFPGVAEGLEHLRSKGRLLAVATGKSRRGLDQALAETGLEQHFDATRCGDEGFSKPHPDMLEYLFGELDVERDAALMVGDTTHDLDMAKAARIDALAVAYGAHQGTSLRGSNPIACLDTPGELWRWLDENA